MVGFNKNKKNNDFNSNSFDDEEEFDLDFEDDIGIEEEIPRKPKSKTSNKPEESVNWKSEGKSKASSKDKQTKVVAICVAVVLVMTIIIGIFVWRYSSNKAKAAEQNRLQQEKLEKEQAELNKDDEKVSTGVPNFYADKNQQNDNKLTGSDKITSDLNKEPVNPDYKIKQIKTVTEFINYEKFRATTANGLEFYWLEAVYKDRPYKVQVPLAIYKELETRGITVVDAEVTVLENNSEIVTYMSVRKDAKTLLERDR